MSAGWSIYVIILVLINVAGALWLLWWTRKRRAGASETHSESQSTTGHVWDGDLTEYNNPLPRWWLWLFYLSVLFAAIYLVLYPGFGNFAGVLGWTQERQHRDEVAVVEQRFAERVSRFASLDLPALSRTPEAMSMARNLFANNCTTCHGSDARGAAGFPNLADTDWLHGANPDTIYQTIANGRDGVMPPWGEALGPQGVEEVIAYVLQLSGKKIPQQWIGNGQTKFQLYCAACHGTDGRGNTQLGAPNLTDDIWLYGDSPEVLRATITQGRNNRMPAHLDILGEQKVRLLAAYVLSLSAESQAPKVADVNP